MSIRTYDALPENAKIYLEFIEAYTKTKIAVVSVGPERTQNIYKIEIL